MAGLWWPPPRGAFPAGHARVTCRHQTADEAAHHRTPDANVPTMALSKTDREEFLSQPHIAALSVNAGAERGPLTVPIWYQYTPGGEPWLLTGAGSRKHQLVEAYGSFSLMVERLEPTVRYVTVEGPVSRVEPGTDDQLVEMTRRYLPPDKAAAYLEFARREHGENVAIYLTPRRWLSADLGSV